MSKYPKTNELRGWSISHCPRNNITGRYTAKRWGVGMCANTYDMIVEMILTKER